MHAESKSEQRKENETLQCQVTVYAYLTAVIGNRLSLAEHIMRVMREKKKRREDV